MSLNKEIYKISKDFFKQKLTAAFASTGQSNDINSDQNLFAINCVRYLLNDQLTFLDPIQKEADFKNFAKVLRLNDFQANGKSLDVGTGLETANNLIYRLAIKFLKTKFNVNLEEIESKITVINKAFSFPDFEGDFLLNVFLDEPETYECITKQAFYKWHYSTYVDNTPVQDKLPRENFLNFSTLGWTSVDVPLLTSKSKNRPVNSTFYVSQNGSPYNTGFPIVCAVFEIGGVKGIDQFLNSNRFKEVEEKIETQLSNIFNRQKTNLNKLTRVEKVTHKGLLLNKDVVYEAKVTKAGKPLLRFCIAYDYQRLVLLNSKGGTKQSSYAALKIALKDFKDTIISFKSTENLDTVSIINSQVRQLSESLTIRDNAVQNGPALFFDVNDPSIDGVKQSLQKQGLDKETVNTLLSRQYSLNLATLSLALTREYSFLTERYLSERQSSALFKNFDPNRISEDITFYFDKSYRLMAVVGENKTTEFNTVLAQEAPAQKNLVPFEFNEGQPLSELDEQFSLMPKIIDDSSLNNSGINGEIAFITEDFVDLYKKNFGSFDFFENESIILSNQHYQKTILKVPTDPLSVITTSINGFFYNSNEIILSDRRRPSAPPLISQDLLKAPINNIIDFFEGPATPDSIGMVNNQPVSNFLLRYHYPRLQVSPSITKQPAQQVLGTILNTTRTLANLTKQALDEGRGLTQKQKQKDNDKLLKKIKQIPDNYPFSSKEKFEAATRRQLMIIAAATSKDPRLKDLTQILSGGGIDAVYEFVLTKFDWDQLVARKLLENLDEVNRIAQTAGDIKNITEAVNKCLDNLGIENVLESFTNLKEGLKDFNKYQQYATKEIPGVSKKLAYTFILDFEQQFRRSLIEAVRQAGLRGVDFIISSALDFLVTKFGDLDDRIEKLISEKLNDGANLDLLGGPDIAGGSIGSNSEDFSQTAEEKFEVDIIEIISDSNIEPLDNVLNGAVEIFPILSIESNKLSDSTLIIREYLDSLSDNITPKQLKALLDGTQGDDLVKLNELVVEDLDTTSLVKTELSSAVALAVLFKYLDAFISRNILDQLIFQSINQSVDACFVKISAVNTEQRQVLRDYLNTSSAPNEPLSDQLNTLANFITGLCSQIDDVINIGRPGSIERLLSDFDRGNLAGLVDANIQSATAQQDPSKQEAFDLNEFVLEAFDNYTSGIETFNNSLKIKNAIKFGPASQFLSAKQKDIILDALKNFSFIPQDIVLALEKFADPNSKVNSFEISGLGSAKTTLTKKGESIIIDIDGTSIEYTPSVFETPENLIGNPIQINPVFDDPNSTGPLAYYELILNRVATNKLTKGKNGYQIEIYKPDNFKADDTDKVNLKPFVKNFFDFVAKKTLGTVKSSVKAEPVKINNVLNSVFEEQQTLVKKYEDRLLQTIDESVSGTEFYMSNLAKMRQLIKKAKG